MYVTYQVTTRGWGQEPSTIYFATFDELLLWTPMIARARAELHAAQLLRGGALMPLTAGEFARFRDAASSVGAQVLA